jgi:Peptidase family M23
MSVSFKQCLWLLGGLLPAWKVWAVAPQLDLPVRCDMGKVCFIQNYVDHDPSPAYQDFACGYLTYNEHAGTDFRVIDEVAMALATPVVAAAPGVVIGVRDGEPDVAVSVRGKANLNGKDAGNGVVIDHGDGWQTQYSHLRKGSVVVQKGQTVARGDVLGMIGESGNADFPHVDFSVRYEGRVVDPFQPKADATCSIDIAKDSLWSASARKALAYVPSAILQAGFSDHIPSRLEAQSGKVTQSMLRTDAPQLVFWVQLMGIRDGDQWQMQITGPDGKVFASGSEKISGNKAVWVGGIGKRRSAALWPWGRYIGSVKLIREGKTVLARQAEVMVQN